MTPIQASRPGFADLDVRLEPSSAERRESGRALFDGAAEIVRQRFQCTLLPERVALETLAQPLAEVDEHAGEFLQQCFLVRGRHAQNAGALNGASSGRTSSARPSSEARWIMYGSGFDAASAGALGSASPV